MTEENHMQVAFDARSVNEGLARMLVSAFMAQMDPTLEQMEDVKTAVSEAVTNAIIHGYSDEKEQVMLCCDRQGKQLTVTVEDQGIGIADLDQAMQPFYTSKPQLDRSSYLSAIEIIFYKSSHHSTESADIVEFSAHIIPDLHVQILVIFLLCLNCFGIHSARLICFCITSV